MIAELRHLAKYGRSTSQSQYQAFAIVAFTAGVLSIRHIKMRLPRCRCMLKAKHIFRFLGSNFIRAESGTFNCSIEWSGNCHLRYKRWPTISESNETRLVLDKVCDNLWSAIDVGGCLYLK